MDKNEMIKNLFELTSIEKQRKEMHDTSPSDYYRLLEINGFKEIDDIYKMPYFSVKKEKIIPQNINDLIDQSEMQKYFRLKKATRFSKEPFSYADFLAIRYVYHGQDIITTPTTSFVMKKNDICMMNAGFTMSQYLRHDEDIVFTFMFEKEYIINRILKYMDDQNIVSKFLYSYVLSNENPQNYILFHGEDNNKMEHIMEDIVMEYIESRPGQIIAIESYIQLLLVEMLRSQFEFEETKESRKYIELAKILSYVNKNYKNLTIKELANKFNYSGDYLSRLIKKATGYNFRDYLSNIKFKNVTKDLKETNLSISNIMERHGFYNETYFYNKFNAIYKMTPMEYRKSR